MRTTRNDRPGKIRYNDIPLHKLLRTYDFQNSGPKQEKRVGEHSDRHVQRASMSRDGPTRLAQADS